MEEKMKTIVIFIAGILNIIGWWGIFKKADIPGWYALIPLLREWKMGKIGWAARVHG